MKENKIETHLFYKSKVEGFDTLLREKGDIDNMIELMNDSRIFIRVIDRRGNPHHVEIVDDEMRDEAIGLASSISIRIESQINKFTFDKKK